MFLRFALRSGRNGNVLLGGKRGIVVLWRSGFSSRYLHGFFAACVCVPAVHLVRQLLYCPSRYTGGGKFCLYLVIRSGKRTPSSQSMHWLAQHRYIA